MDIVKKSIPVRPVINAHMCNEHAGRVAAFNRNDGSFIRSESTYQELDDYLAKNNIERSTVIRFHFPSKS